jgi:hypothetical protein
MNKSAKAFISYSHVDERALERLTNHLAVLRREKALVQWFDQKILAGGKIDGEISKQLGESAIFLALVSADFLASNYCYEQEFSRAVAMEEAGKLRIVPIIVEPCEWQRTPLQRYKALPKDGKPVSEWTNENNAWLNVVSELRRVIEEGEASRSKAPVPLAASSKPKGQKYRVKRDFDDVDRMTFRDKAFATLRDYFEKAAAEVAEIEEIKSRFLKLGDDGFTCTVVNRARQHGAAHITVYCGGGRHSFGDITYSFQERAERGTANGWLSIVWDDYDLFLEDSSMRRGGEEVRLTPHAAAQQLWEEFLGQAGVENG